MHILHVANSEIARRPENQNRNIVTAPIVLKENYRVLTLFNKYHKLLFPEFNTLRPKKIIQFLETPFRDTM